GPAGEHRVRFAAMAHYWKNREGVSGRGGLGAVLGSKNLKAGVARGAQKTGVADAPALKTIIERTRQPLRPGTKALPSVRPPPPLSGGGRTTRTMDPAHTTGDRRRSPRRAPPPSRR